MPEVVVRKKSICVEEIFHDGGPTAVKPLRRVESPWKERMRSSTFGAFSFLIAVRLARRIGLVNTMVFTHIPSSVLLVLAAFSSSLDVTLGLLLVQTASPPGMDTLDTCWKFPAKAACCV